MPRATRVPKATVGITGVRIKDSFRKNAYIEAVAKAKSAEAHAVLEQQYRQVAEAIPQIVWTADPDGFVDYFNRRWFEYTGFTPEETYSESRTAIHPDDRERYKTLWSESLKTGKEYTIEYRFKRASDGEYRWHLGRAIPVKDADGHIIKWFGTCTDIHDQKMAEAEVRKLNDELEVKVELRTRELRDQVKLLREMEETNRASHTRLQSVMDSISIGAVLLDENLEVLYANDRFCNLLDLNRQPKDVAGQKFTKVVRMIMSKLVQPEGYLERLNQTLEDRVPKEKVELELKNGRTLSREYIPILVDSAHRGHLLLYRDITREKRIDASKSEFMSLASHQLRTPLTAIRWVFGKLSKMKETAEDEAAAYLIDEGRKATLRMASTIDTMLTISRIEAGSVKLRLTDLALSHFLVETADHFQTELQERNQTVRIDGSDSLFLVTDANLLREVLRNLVSNAIKYSPNGKEIVIGAQEQGDGIRIFVSDSGYGIPSDQRKKIFSKFFRGSNVIDNETDGTGLGLYLVQQLVTMLGGHVSFESEEGRGTTFSVLFPPLPPLDDPQPMHH